MGMHATTAAMAEAVDAGWSQNELFRLCIVEYARLFHASTDEERLTLVEARPRITNTIWDAAIGGSIEHACLTHWCEPPAWTEEKERFREGPDLLLWQWTDTVFCHLPAPFTRRGIAFDGRNLDERTGDDAWRPTVGDPDERWPRQAPPTRNEGRSHQDGTQTRTARACEEIEAEAIRSGWAVRISIQEGDRPSRAFALRGRNAGDGRIIGLGGTETTQLIAAGLRRAGIDEPTWEQLLKEEQDRRPNAPRPPTIWNRPGLTVAGTAGGILARWEEACPTSR